MYSSDKYTNTSKVTVQPNSYVQHILCRVSAGKKDNLSDNSCSTETITLMGKSNAANERLTAGLQICPKIQYALNVFIGKSQD